MTPPRAGRHTIEAISFRRGVVFCSCGRQIVPIDARLVKRLPDEALARAYQAHQADVGTPARHSAAWLATPELPALRFRRSSG